MSWKGFRTCKTQDIINMLSMHCRRNQKSDYLHQHMDHTCKSNSNQINWGNL